MGSIYAQFATSVLRKALIALGALLVHRGWADEGAVQEVAAGLAVVLVTAGWEFYVLHRQALYERWLILLGLREPKIPTDAQPLVARAIEADARQRIKDGYRP